MNDLNPFGLREDEVSRSSFSPSAWFSMLTDNDQPVCAAVIRLLAMYNSLPMKYFGKLLTLCICLCKGSVRPVTIHFRLGSLDAGEPTHGSTPNCACTNAPAGSPSDCPPLLMASLSLMALKRGRHLCPDVHEYSCQAGCGALRSSTLYEATSSRICRLFALPVASSKDHREMPLAKLSMLPPIAARNSAARSRARIFLLAPRHIQCSHSRALTARAAPDSQSARARNMQVLSGESASNRQGNEVLVPERPAA